MSYRTILPSAFTVGNLFCGFWALRYVIEGNYVPAAWLIVLGACLDNMDGRIARLVGKESRFGVEIDSLVDVCTFGVVPAVMVYRSLFDTGWGSTIAFVFLLAGAFRLARYNILSQDGEKGEFFTGLPIPMAAIALSQYVVFTETAWSSEHAATLAVAMVLFLSYLMVSSIEYDPVPNFRSTAFMDRFKQVYFLGSIVLICLPATSKQLFFPLVLSYLLIGIYRRVWGIFSDEVTQHA